MRANFLLPLFALGVFALPGVAQSMLEMGGITAGSAVGSAAGKQVSSGITSVMRKVGTTTDKAAKAKGAKAQSGVPVAPALEVTSGVPRSGGYNVPPPPPSTHKATVTSRPAPAAAPRRVPVPVVYAAPTPRREVNVDLSAVETGMKRAELLKLGDPSARITMDEDGHLVEIYHYQNVTLAPGTVRLRDGAVASIQAQ